MIISQFQILNLETMMNPEAIMKVKEEGHLLIKEGMNWKDNYLGQLNSF